jgi:phosphoribosylformylglycinamidine synthase
MAEDHVWRADVYVALKASVNDPQGLAVRDGLHRLGYDEVDRVRVGRYLQIWLAGADQEVAARRVREMCERLLANPVIEDYRFELVRE